MLNKLKEEIILYYKELLEQEQIINTNEVKQSYIQDINNNRKTALYFAMKSIDIEKLNNLSEKEITERTNDYNKNNNLSLSELEYMEFLYENIGTVLKSMYKDMVNNFRYSHLTDLEQNINKLSFEEVNKLLTLVENLKNEKEIYESKLVVDSQIPKILKDILINTKGSKDSVKYLVNNYLSNFNESKKEFNFKTDFEIMKDLVDNVDLENIDIDYFVNNFRYMISLELLEELGKLEKRKENSEKLQSKFRVLGRVVKYNDEKVLDILSKIHYNVKNKILNKNFITNLGVYSNLNFKNEETLALSIKEMKDNYNVVTTKINELLETCSIKYDYEDRKINTLNKIMDILKVNNIDLSELLNLFNSTKYKNLSKVVEIKDKIYTQNLIGEILKASEQDKNNLNSKSLEYKKIK